MSWLHAWKIFKMSGFVKGRASGFKARKRERIDDRDHAFDADLH